MFAGVLMMMVLVPSGVGCAILAFSIRSFSVSVLMSPVTGICFSVLMGLNSPEVEIDAFLPLLCMYAGLSVLGGCAGALTGWMCRVLLDTILGIGMAFSMRRFGDSTGRGQN